MSSYNRHFIKATILSTAASVILVKYIISRYYDKKRNKCIVIKSLEDWNAHESEILTTFEESSVIGIDCEWVTVDNSRNPVSLLQLANKNGFCVLIRLFCIPVWSIPLGLAELLRDKSILKVGVGVSDDAGKLFHDYCLEVQGFLDLRYLASNIEELQGKSLGLKTLSKELLGYDLNKSETLRCSNWDADSLTPSQIKYAADDALVSAKLFENIKHRKSGWLKLNSQFYEEVEMYMDVPFKQNLSNASNAHSNNYSSQIHVKSVMKHKTRYSKPRLKQLYDNCQIVAPDNELLCSCDRNKAQWYVFKGLGEVVNEEPFTVRLNFEPSGRPTLDNVFYCKEKENLCVVCGKTENYHRKLVVPSEYRKYFPNLMKKNLSHDVLLLCMHCHKRSNILDQVMRLKLVEMCDAPLINSRNTKYQLNPELARVKSAAKALIVSGKKIPESRKKVLEKVILDSFKVSEMTEEILEQAYHLDTSTLNDSFVAHGLKVYQYFCNNGGLIEFERMWRQHFLDTMKPKYLPDMWSVDHNHKRLAIQVIHQQREVNFDVSILGLSYDLLKEVKDYELE